MDVATEVGIGHASAHRLFHDILHYCKVSSRWVPHPTAATVNDIATFGWQPLDHVPCSPDLAPSDFHFFPTLKRTLEGRHFTNEDVEAAVRTFVHTQDTEFYREGFFKLVKRWDKCISVVGDHVDK
jgi:histone-lysine N-methyltransferase SETMAR